MGTDGLRIVSLFRGSSKPERFRFTDPLSLYVSTLAIGAVCLCVALVWTGATISSTWLLSVLVATAVLGERLSVQLSATTVLSLALLPTAFAAVVLGPLAGAIVGAASMLGDEELLRRVRPATSTVQRWITYTAVGFLSGACSGIAAEALQGTGPSNTASLILMTLGAIAAAEASDFILGMSTGLLRGRPARAHARKILPVIVTSLLVYAPVAALFVTAYELVSPWTLPLFLVPTFALQRIYALYRQQRHLTDGLTDANDQLKGINDILRSANLSFATALVQTLEESDRYTAGHSRAVAVYARDISRQLGLPSDHQDRIFLCGLVHDIGKIGLPSALLNKDGRLTLEERREMERHSVIGERILSKVDAYSDVSHVVRHHHERLDGEGYPDRLKGDKIPLASRIIAVADAYNAMTSDRPYRKAMDFAVARERLLQAMGSQFFVEPVVAFLAVLANADDAYRYARSGDFGAVDPETVRDLLDQVSASADAA